MRFDPPLTPDGDDARSELRRELLRADYQETDILDRVLRWFSRRFDEGLSLADGAPPLTTFASMLILIALVLALSWLLSRARRSPRRARAEGPVLTGETVTAAQLRRRAEEALARGDDALALVEGFRALTVRQIERGVAPDSPGATAHEVALILASVHPRRDAALHEAADLFDRVLYGHHSATREQATGMLALDDDLVGVR
ncbi:DUF4129 domain-containing protein [Nocardioides pacificus]